MRTSTGSSGYADVSCANPSRLSEAAPNASAADVTRHPYARPLPRLEDWRGRGFAACCASDLSRQTRTIPIPFMRTRSRLCVPRSLRSTSVRAGRIMRPSQAKHSTCVRLCCARDSACESVDVTSVGIVVGYEAGMRRAKGGVRMRDQSPEHPPDSRGS
ncbi:hypothetical protein B0H14DRAFT_1702992 [Mycena olivaceomarginata]|nr:hypothetical protein B0H14DRAFT_1702992 [Mycena olivaceomarginata]